MLSYNGWSTVCTSFVRTVEDTADSSNRETSRWRDDPGDGGGKWGAEWVRVVWCGYGAGEGAEGRAGVSIGSILKNYGRLGGV